MDRKSRGKVDYKSVRSEYDQAIEVRDEYRLKQVADKVFNLAFEHRYSPKGEKYMSLFDEIDFDLISMETGNGLDNRGEL